jgi:hypothetical protein
MNKGSLLAIAVIMGASLAKAAPTALPPQAGAAAPQAVRPIGVVTEIQPGQLTLHTDAGPSMIVQLPDGVAILRVPPGAKDLKSATPIALGDITTGDRVLVRGAVSEDQKSVVAKSVIVMSRAQIAEAHHEEALEWQQHGIGGVVKSVNPAAMEISIAVPSNPPTPGNLARLVVVILKPSAVLLRYAPDSVKFSDAKPSDFSDIHVGDQVRALGTKSADGALFSAEKLVSGTFRNIGATVISVDAAAGTVTVKDLANGKPLLVRTNPDSKLHTLPTLVAMMIARFNSGGGAPGGAALGGQGGEARGGSQGGGGEFRGRATPQGEARPQGQGGPMGGPGGMRGGPPRDFNQMLDRMPALAIGDLKPGQAVIVVSTEGAKPSEVTAIALLAGVEPILQARPKGSSQVVLGPWNMSMGGGGDEGP